MKQRGRKTTADKNVVDIGAAVRPRPPEKLTSAEKRLWNDIVGSRVADFFDAATIPMLAEYCRVQTEVDCLACAVVEFEPDWLKEEEGLRRYERLVAMQDKAQKRMLAFATKMRLAQQSRFVPDKAGNRPTPGSGRKPWESDD